MQGEKNFDKVITTRGFRFYRFKDAGGEDCCLLENSGISENHVCLGTAGNGMHLSQAQVTELLPLLKHFADTGAAMKFNAGTITVYDRETGKVLHQGECLDFEVTPEKPALKDEDLVQVHLEGTAGQIQMCIAPVSFWTKIQTHPAIQVAYENWKREQQDKVTAVTSSEFFDKLTNHPQAQKAKRRLATKVLGAQWKRERKGFQP